jgi:hypothetical protein
MNVLTSFFNGKDPSQMYSVEKLQEFNEYCKKTTSRRLWCVICLTPFTPMLIYMTGHFVPLASPNDGWKENYAYFLRMAILSLLFMLGQVLPSTIYLPHLNASSLEIACVAIPCTLMYLAQYIGFAAYWKFPVPFGLVAPFPLVVPVGIFTFIRYIVKPQKAPVSSSYSILRSFTSSISTSTSLSMSSQNMIPIFAFIKVAIFNMTIIAIYPLYGVGFDKIINRENTTATLVYWCMIPILKFVLTCIIHKIVAPLVDFTVEATVFSVNFANSLFVSICLGQNKITASIYFIMILNGLQIVYTLVKVTIYSREYIQLKNQYERKFHPVDLIKENLEIVAKYQNEILQSRHIRMKSFRSTHQIFTAQVHPSENNNRNKLQKKKKKQQQRFHEINQLSTSDEISTSSVTGTIQIAPINTLKNVVAYQSFRDPTVQQKLKFLEETLYILHHIENAVAKEYVEAFFPFVYALYLTLIFHSPSKPYLTSVMNENMKTLSTSIHHMMLYGGLEVVSLLTLSILIYRLHGFNVFRMLAFCLESNYVTIMCKLYCFFCFILSFHLVHGGV